MTDPNLSPSTDPSPNPSSTPPGNGPDMTPAGSTVPESPSGSEKTRSVTVLRKWFPILTSFGAGLLAMALVIAGFGLFKAPSGELVPQEASRRRKTPLTPAARQSASWHP